MTIEGDENFVVITFFVATKPKREGLKGRSLLSSSCSGFRFKILL
jgi:hypothetical protein